MCLTPLLEEAFRETGHGPQLCFINIPAALRITRLCRSGFLKQTAPMRNNASKIIQDTEQFVIGGLQLAHCGSKAHHLRAEWFISGGPLETACMLHHASISKANLAFIAGKSVACMSAWVGNATEGQKKLYSRNKTQRTHNTIQQ